MGENIILSMKDYLGRLRRDSRQKLYAPLAECYRRTNLIDDAEETAITGLNMFPTYLLCREVLGKVYFKQGQWARAREQLEKVASVVKDNLELSRVLGKVYFELGMTEEAMSHFRFVSEKDPFDFEVHNLMAQSKQSQPQGTEPEQEDHVDMFTESVEEKIYDIERIVKSMDKPEVLSRSQYSRATDHALDTLENVEGDIDAKADEIFKNLQDQSPAQRPKPIRMTRNISESNKKEIKAAAMIGQIHLELHLLDEALIQARKHLKEDPTDVDIVEICGKFEHALDLKEAELVRIEEMSLATGL